MAIYLFEYKYLGDKYVLEVEADGLMEARHRLNCMHRAEYFGTGLIKISVSWIERLAKLLGL